jgi:hypothetical protein
MANISSSGIKGLLWGFLAGAVASAFMGATGNTQGAVGVGFGVMLLVAYSYNKKHSAKQDVK